jgi:pimeloyl-ACP methyl ester carboxylesterase
MMKTLVMIPAFGCDERLYAPQMAAWAEQWDIHVIVPSADRYIGMVEDVLAQAPERFVIMGTSMGGRVALETTLAAPKRVQGLVIIGAGAGAVADPATGLKRSARIRGGEKQQVLIEMGNMISHLPGSRGQETREAFIRMGEAMDPETLARQSDALAHRTDKWARLREIYCPVLCLWGVHDQFSPAADGRRVAAAVQQGEYVELPECGHFPTLEYPDKATEVLSQWLTSLD